jgi:hypothetical protein
VGNKYLTRNFEWFGVNSQVYRTNERSWSSSKVFWYLRLQDLIMYRLFRTNVVVNITCLLRESIECVKVKLKLSHYPMQLPWGREHLSYF